MAAERAVDDRVSKLEYERRGHCHYKVKLAAKQRGNKTGAKKQDSLLSAKKGRDNPKVKSKQVHGQVPEKGAGKKDGRR